MDQKEMIKGEKEPRKYSTKQESEKFQDFVAET